MPECSVFSGRLIAACPDTIFMYCECTKLKVNLWGNWLRGVVAPCFKCQFLLKSKYWTKIRWKNAFPSYLHLIFVGLEKKFLWSYELWASVALNKYSAFLSFVPLTIVVMLFQRLFGTRTNMLSQKMECLLD